MSLQNEFLYYSMIVGVGLASAVLLPYPRFLRKPLVHGLEALLTQKYMAKAQLVIYCFVSFLLIQAYVDQNRFQQDIIGYKAQMEVAPEGVSRIEMQRTLDKARMDKFYAQRNFYLAFFTLILYFVVFTYLYSLKKKDALLDEKEKLSQRAQHAEPAVPQAQAKK